MSTLGSIRVAVRKQHFNQLHFQRSWYSVLVTGANRGIGLEFCKQYLAKQFSVYACCRDPYKAYDLEKLQKSNSKQISIQPLDVANDQSILELSDSLKNIPIDVLILNAGISGDKANSELGLLYRDDLLNTININCISSLLIGQSLFENVKMSKRKQIVGISSLMGSITDNEQRGGRVAYRVSKTAMNAVFQEFKLKGKEFNIHTLLLHPGWVQTEMGGQNATKTIGDSVEEVMNVIDNYNNLESGGFYNYAGERLSW